MWQKIVGPFKEFGWGAGWLYAADRVLRRLSPRFGLYFYEMMAQPIVTKALLPASLARNIEYIELLEGHPDIARMPARTDIKAQRFRHGARCLAAYKKGELLGYAWFSRGQYEEDEVRCTYVLGSPADSVFDFDFYVMPEHRMGIAFMAIWHGANEFLRAQGVAHTFSRMTRFNLASRRAHRRLGAVCVARAWFLQLGPLELMVSDSQPFAGLTWRSSQRVTLPLPSPAGQATAPAP